MKTAKNKMLSRLLCVALALLCALSLASCNLADILPSGLFRGNAGAGNGDGSFAPNEIEEVTKTVFQGSYRDQLNGNEMAVYDAVAAAAAGEHTFTVTLADKIEICKGRAPTEDEKKNASGRISFWITNALYAVWLDCPQLFWMETGNYEYSYSMVPDSEGIYRVEKVELTVEARENAKDALLYGQHLNAALSALSLKRGSDYETVLAINDYLCSLIAYDLNAKNRENIYGALIEKICVCEGYAHAFKLLCDKYGVACATIIGTGHTEEGSEGHMWNAVLLDGKWYAVDVTWNDQKDKSARNSFLLVGSGTVIFAQRFDKSHETEYTRGESKVFASPKLSEKAYKSQK